MKKVLVVWSEIPEEFSLVSLTVDEATHDKLAKFHNYYINGNAPNDLSQEINDFFYPGYGSFQYVKETGPLTSVSYDLVIQCGIIL